MEETLKKAFSPISDEEERIGKILVDSAFTIHKHFGPGLLEKVYEVSLTHELRKRGLTVSRQVDIPIVYDGVEFEEGLRLDLLIENKVICEVKAIETVNPVWEAQVLSQLKLSGKRLGYLVNFNVPLIKNGIKRFVI
ncbi:MAG TPA: GxxExxY protein [Bacteroidia bacterium]|nr:GxxExxY protein [Bacteroidia bacterium]